ncbi:MAG: hypothetical protein RIR10_1187 [Planctomycetota bacterium]
MARDFPRGSTVSFPRPIRYADFVTANNSPPIACRLLALLACVCAALLLTACAADKCDLDRVGTPLRFADLRETAAWTPDFDRAWWNDIDRAYVAYDEEVGRIARTSWDPFVRALVASEQTGFPKERRAARAMWESHLRVRRALSEAEFQFCEAMRAALPDAADTFIDLLRARGAFWRESAVWVPHGQRAPGPLEVLSMTGPPFGDAATARAAIETYERLAPIARRAAEERFEAYLDYCEVITEAEREVVAAKDARESLPVDATKREIEIAEARLKAASVAVDGANQVLNKVTRREADEKFRIALLREDRAFGEALTDGERLVDYLDRVEAFLHIGLRSHQSLRALRAVALRVAEQRFPDDEVRRSDIEKAFDDYFQEDKRLRARLASGSTKDRAAAYTALLQLVGPLYKKLTAATGVAGESLEYFSIEVSAGRRNAEESADAVVALADGEPAQQMEVSVEVPDVDETIGQTRDQGMRIFAGSALSPRVVRALSAGLRLDVERAASLDQFRADEATRLAQSTASLIERFRETGRRLEKGSAEGGDGRSTESRVRDTLREITALTTSFRAVDRSANERLLAEAARLGDVSIDDTRIATARIEFELLSLLGATADMQEWFVIGGTAPEAVVNPFELVRTMDADAVIREASEALVLAHADELRAAHQEAATAQLRNAGEFLVRLIDRQRDGGLPSEPWYPVACGTRAITIRTEIARELGRVLGPAAERAFHERWRAMTRPTMTPARERHRSALEVFIAGARLTKEAREQTDGVRRSIAEVLVRADASREDALQQLHAFVATWITGAGVRSEEDWKTVASRSAAAAWLRSRVIDADQRAFAQCQRLLADQPAAADFLLELETIPVQLPARFAPYFPE